MSPHVRELLMTTFLATIVTLSVGGAYIYDKPDRMKDWLKKDGVPVFIGFWMLFGLVLIH